MKVKFFQVSPRTWRACKWRKLPLLVKGWKTEMLGPVGSTCSQGLCQSPQAGTTNTVNSLLSCKILNNSTCLLIHLMHANSLPAALAETEPLKKQVTQPSWSSGSAAQDTRLVRRPLSAGRSDRFRPACRLRTLRSVSRYYYCVYMHVMRRGSSTM